MKRLLLGTSALVGGVLVAGSAMAQLELTISGEYNFAMAFVDDDTSATANADDFGTKSGGNLQFNADAVADNGLQYGLEFELDDGFGAGSDIGLEEAYGYVQGNWGYLRFGDKEGASNTLAIKAPLVAGDSFIDSDAFDFLESGRGDMLFDTVALVGGDEDDTKIMYSTTGLDLGGFTAGVSWTPNADSRGESEDSGARFASRQEDAANDEVQAAANWKGSFSGVDVAIGAAYNFGDGGTSDRGNDVEDLGAWQVGLTVGYGGFTVGALYMDNSDSYSGGVFETANETADLNHDDWHIVNVGLAYETGPWEAGLAYSYAEADLTNTQTLASGTREEQRYGGGLKYTVAPGLSVRGEAGWFDFDDAGVGDNANNDGFIALLTTSLTF